MTTNSPTTPSHLQTTATNQPIIPSILLACTDRYLSEALSTIIHTTGIGQVTLAYSKAEALYFLSSSTYTHVFLSYYFYLPSCESDIYPLLPPNQFTILLSPLNNQQLLKLIGFNSGTRKKAAPVAILQLPFSFNDLHHLLLGCHRVPPN